MEVKHYAELRKKILEEIAGWNSPLKHTFLLEFIAKYAVDENYYAWFMRYLQMACFQLKVDLAQAELSVRIIEHDNLIFVVRLEDKEVTFTGRVAGHQIVLAYSQIPTLKEDWREETNKDGGADPS